MCLSLMEVLDGIVKLLAREMNLIAHEAGSLRYGGTSTVEENQIIAYRGRDNVMKNKQVEWSSIIFVG